MLVHEGGIPGEWDRVEGGQQDAETFRWVAIGSVLEQTGEARPLDGNGAEKTEVVRRGHRRQAAAEGQQEQGVRRPGHG